jgi:hypothetical protein
MNIEFAPPSAVSMEQPRRSPWLVAIGLGLAVLVGGALCWALIAYFLERVSLAIAFFMGTFAAMAFAYPFKPIDRRKAVLLFVPSVFTTLAGILLGEFLFVVFVVMREVPCTLGVAVQFVLGFPELVFQGAELAISLFLGIAGAVLGYVNVVRRARQ